MLDIEIQSNSGQTLWWRFELLAAVEVGAMESSRVIDGEDERQTVTKRPNTTNRSALFHFLIKL